MSIRPDSGILNLTRLLVPSHSSSEYSTESPCFMYSTASNSTDSACTTTLLPESACTTHRWTRCSRTGSSNPETIRYNTVSPTLSSPSGGVESLFGKKLVGSPTCNLYSPPSPDTLPPAKTSTRPKSGISNSRKLLSPGPSSSEYSTESSRTTYSTGSNFLDSTRTITWLPASARTIQRCRRYPRIGSSKPESESMYLLANLSRRSNVSESSALSNKSLSGRPIYNLYSPLTESE